MGACCRAALRRFGRGAAAWRRRRQGTRGRPAQFGALPRVEMASFSSLWPQFGAHNVLARFCEPVYRPNDTGASQPQILPFQRAIPPCTNDHPPEAPPTLPQPHFQSLY